MKWGKKISGSTKEKRTFYPRVGFDLERVRYPEEERVFDFERGRRDLFFSTLGGQSQNDFEGEGLEGVPKTSVEFGLELNPGDKEGE